MLAQRIMCCCRFLPQPVLTMWQQPYWPSLPPCRHPLCPLLLPKSVMCVCPHQALHLPCWLTPCHRQNGLSLDTSQVSHPSPPAPPSSSTTCTMAPLLQSLTMVPFSVPNPLCLAVVIGCHGCDHCLKVSWSQNGVATHLVSWTLCMQTNFVWSIRHISLQDIGFIESLPIKVSPIQTLFKP